MFDFREGNHRERSGLQQHLFRVEKVVAGVVRKLKIFSKDDGSRRASVLTVTAENAPYHIDFVFGGVSLSR